MSLSDKVLPTITSQIVTDFQECYYLNYSGAIRSFQTIIVKIVRICICLPINGLSLLVVNIFSFWDDGISGNIFDVLHVEDIVKNLISYH